MAYGVLGVGAIGAASSRGCAQTSMTRQRRCSRRATPRSRREGITAVHPADAAATALFDRLGETVEMFAGL
jgi:hypothetical protein